MTTSANDLHSPAPWPPGPPPQPVQQPAQAPVQPAFQLPAQPLGARGAVPPPPPAGPPAMPTAGMPPTGMPPGALSPTTLPFAGPPPVRPLPAEPEPPTRALLATLAVALPPAALTLVLCLYGIGRRQLWRDEHATWWASELSWSQLGDLIGHMDLVLAPYYVLMHLWIDLFGDSEAALRVPTALAMTGAAAAVALLGRRLLTPRLGVLAGLLFAICPAITWYGQDARPYAFAVLAAVVSTLVLTRILQRAEPVRRHAVAAASARRVRWNGPLVLSWAGYAATVVAMGLTHLVTLSILAGHLLMIAHTARRTGPLLRFPAPLGRWSLATAGALLLLAPVVVLGAGQSDQIGWNHKDWKDLGELPSKLAGSESLGWVLLVLGVLGIAALLSLRQPVGLLACWALLPVAATATTAPWLHLFLDRYLLFTVPAWTLLVAAAIGRVPGLASLTTVSRTPPRWVVGPVPLLLVFLLAVGVAWPDQGEVRKDLNWEMDSRAAARVIDAGQRPGDAMVFEPGTSLRRAMAYEFRGRTAPLDALMSRTPQEAKGFGAIECFEPAPCLAKVQRVWLLLGTGDKRPYGAVSDKVSKELKQFKTVRTDRLPNLRLVLLERTPAKPKG
ncbi:glycosyltransferase family 39 protein [Kitasatospora sp. NPDC050543]|uniref:glycosyltransferase family 39 protein n=1 Tax=Kitasatospora sp. NPDC050543 TaxID=3364054 RepID=UPI0037994F2E